MNVQDRRRLLGPANAKPIVFSGEKAAKPEPEQEQGDDVQESVLLRQGLIENSNGSSLVEVNSGKRQLSLMASVYGPRALRSSFTSTASISIQLQNGSQEKYNSTQLREVGTFLTSVFNAVVNRSRYPKSGIDIFVYLTYDRDVNQTSGSNISALIPHCITSITLALVDAGIEILDLASGGYHNGNVFSFIKNGDEITGFWKDEGVCEDITDSLEICKQSYLRYKSLMVGTLMEGKVH